MALSIKTDEADWMARELAALTNESLTEAVTNALRERLERVRHDSELDVLSRLRRLSRECSALPVADDRSPEDIIGYDEFGPPH